MIIRGDTDATYLVASKARSRNTAFAFMGNRDKRNQIINRSIMIIARTLKMVEVLVVEIEIASLYYVVQKIVPLQVNTEELGHK